MFDTTWARVYATSEINRSELKQLIHWGDPTQKEREAWQKMA